MSPADPIAGNLLAPDASLLEAIERMDAVRRKLIVVVDADRRLLGTVSDGDIRRGLMRRLGMEAPVSAVMNREPVAIRVAGPEAEAMVRLSERGVSLAPLLDGGGRVVGLYPDAAIATKARDNLVVIMAGGRGVRLLPHTENCPKPLLPVGGKPMLEHIIERAKAEGFHRFMLAVHYLGHMIENHFGDGSRWQVEIEYLREQTPLGTAGALGLLPKRPTEPFLVTNGDVLTDIRYGELLDFHQRHRAAATMAVRLHEWQHPFGVVKTRGVDIVGFEEKPVSRSHINAGIYVLEPQALDLLAHDEHCDMPSLFERLGQRAERAIVYPMHEPWLDVGRPDDLKAARDNLGTAS